MAGLEEAKFFCYVEKCTATKEREVIYTGEPLSPHQAEDLVAQQTSGYGLSIYMMNTFGSRGGRITLCQQKITRNAREGSLDVDASLPNAVVHFGMNEDVFEGLLKIIHHAALIGMIANTTPAKQP